MTYINRERGSKEGNRERIRGIVGGRGVGGGSEENCRRGSRVIVREEVRGTVRLTYINREVKVFG